MARNSPQPAKLPPAESLGVKASRLDARVSTKITAVLKVEHSGDKVPDPRDDRVLPKYYMVWFDQRRTLEFCDGIDSQAWPGCMNSTSTKTGT